MIFKVPFNFIEQEPLGLDEKTWATAIAIAYMSEKLQNLKETWELVALKATKWLQKITGANYNAVMEAATAYIKSL